MTIKVAVKTVEIIDMEPVRAALSKDGFTFVECTPDQLQTIVKDIEKDHTLFIQLGNEDTPAITPGHYLLVARVAEKQKAKARVSAPTGRKVGPGRPAGPAKTYEATRTTDGKQTVYTGTLTELATQMGVSRMALYLAVSKKAGEAKGLGVTLKEVVSEDL